MGQWVTFCTVNILFFSRFKSYVVMGRWLVSRYTAVLKSHGILKKLNISHHITPVEWAAPPEVQESPRMTATRSKTIIIFTWHTCLLHVPIIQYVVYK